MADYQTKGWDDVPVKAWDSGSSSVTDAPKNKDYSILDMPEAIVRKHLAPVFGSAENLANFITGMAATPVAGLAGLGVPLTNKIGLTNTSPADAVRNVQSALTYQPQTREGQAAQAATQFLPEQFSKGMSAVADIVRGNSPIFPNDTTNPVRDFAATNLNILGEAAPTLFGLKGLARDIATRSPLPEDPRAKLIRDARDKGLVVNPADVRRGGLLQGLAEGESGKGATDRLASVKNAPKVQDILGKYIGLSPGQEITPASLAYIREQAGQPYEAVKNIGRDFKVNSTVAAAENDLATNLASLRRGMPRTLYNEGVYKVLDDLTDAVKRGTMDPNAAVESWKELTKLSKQHASTDMSLSLAEGKAASAIFDMMSEDLKANGQGSLAADIKTARATIAKTWDMQESLVGSGNAVSPARLGQAQTKAERSGRSRMEGDMKTVVDLQREFPKSFQDSPAYQPWNPWDTSRMTWGGRLAAVASARPLVREMLLSNWYQNGLLKPQYAPLNYDPAIMGLLASDALNQAGNK